MPVANSKYRTDRVTANCSGGVRPSKATWQTTPCQSDRGQVALVAWLEVSMGSQPGPIGASTEQRRALTDDRDPLDRGRRLGRARACGPDRGHGRDHVRRVCTGAGAPLAVPVSRAPAEEEKHSRRGGVDDAGLHTEVADRRLEPGTPKRGRQKVPTSSTCLGVQS
jgi:hypothetical protein